MTTADELRDAAGLRGVVDVGPGPRETPWHGLAPALDALQRTSTLDELLDQAPVAAAALGFDRVLLSRIEDGLWVPERMYVRGDVRGAAEILEAGRRELRRLDASLLETRLVRNRLPLSVADPDHEPLVHAALVRSSRTRGYVAAAVVIDEEVVGFVHADCHHQQRMPTSAEVETLRVFALALGPLLDRQSLRDRLTAGRTALDRPAAPFAALETTSDRRRRATGHAASTRSTHHALADRVTRREADVLVLMCAGASNEQIARRLVITIGTVKSHVKSILRKLGAANRAEAVSSWLRSEYGRLSVGPPGSE